MSDFEERLRATVRERSEGFEPAPDLPDRIHARVEQHRRRLQLVVGGFVSAAAAVVAVVVLLTNDRSDDDSIRTVDDTSTTIDEPDETTSTTSTTSSTTSTGPGPGAGPLIDSLTPLSRQGIGPITAGMTLREAQSAANITVTVAAPTGTARPCAEATIDGVDPSPILVVEPRGADPLDGIVRAVWGGYVPGDDDILVGMSRAELITALGQPTREEDIPGIGLPASFLVFESGGSAYGVYVSDDLVLRIESGDPAWVNPDEGCPE